MKAIDWTGISYPFRIENGGVAKSKSTLFSKDGTSPHLSESIRQICTQMTGERLVDMIGIRIRPYQFATFSNEFDAYLEVEVKDAIEKYEPRVQVTDVIVKRDKRRGQVVLSIGWVINEAILGSPDTDGYRTEVFLEGGTEE